MRKTLASILSTGASPWKFLLLAATLLFSYAIPVHADDHEEAAVVEEAEAGPVDDYNGLLEHQGAGAPAFDFSPLQCCGRLSQLHSSFLCTLDLQL